MAKKIIIRQEYGQLGNILFRLANTLGYAIEHDYKVEDYTLAFCNYHDGSSNIRFFENHHPFQFFEYPQPKFCLSNRIKWYLRDKYYQKYMIIQNLDPSFDLQKLEPKKSYELKGFHFSSGELTIKHRKQICNILRFRKAEVNRIQHLLKGAKKRYDILLGVHIRLKDYNTFYDGKFYLTINQYLKSVEHFKSLLMPSQRVAVVVCSDDMDAIQSIEKEQPDYFYPKGNIAQDIYALSQCDYNIGPMATTMSTWASYLGESLHLQIHKQIDSFELANFQKIKRLEPFNPFKN